MNLYLICNGCGESFHAMNYQAAYEHGSAVTPTEWCGQNGFILSETPEV